MSDPEDEAETDVALTEVVVKAPGAGDRDALPVGSVLGDYVVECVLGTGGGGIVYEARHRERGERVAIKALRGAVALEPGMFQRFRREVEALNLIQHPNIVAVRDFDDRDPFRTYYVMELLDGCDLSALLKTAGRLSPEHTLELVAPVCDAVQAAHEAGIIHRDIKARNVFVARIDGKLVIKLLDFGIAKALDEVSQNQGLTEPGARLGTAHYMSPEQVRGESIDQRTDIYAIGVLLFQLLTGQYPFPGSDSLEVAAMQLTTPPPRPSTFAPVHPEIEKVVLRCLEKAREKRFASAKDLLVALRAAVLGESMPQSPETSHRAVGIYFAAATDEGSLDDASLEQLSMLFERIEQELAPAGYAFPLRSDTVFLALRLLEPRADADSALRATRALIGGLDALLDAESVLVPSPGVAVSAAVDQVLCETSESGREIVGGPLLRAREWADGARVALFQPRG